MQIRQASPADADVLARLNAHVHDVHVAAEPHLYRATEPASVRAWYAEQLDDPAQAFLIGERDGSALGFVATKVVEQAPHTFAHGRRFMLVDQLAVAPEARRNGYGRALMEAAHALARARGCASVELNVRSFNEAAIRFYASLGYAAGFVRMQRDL